MSARRDVLRAWPLAALAALIVAGCAASGPAVRDAAGPRPTVVMLPLENLSGRAEYGERFSRLVWTLLGRSGRFDMVDPGQVDAMLVELRIRSSGSLTTEQVLKTAGRLHARWVVAGTLLESGVVRSPEGDIPSFGLSLRVLDGSTGKVVWTDLRARTGQDRETIFGWGREENLERLAEATARDLIDHLQTPELPDTSHHTEGRP